MPRAVGCFRTMPAEEALVELLQEMQERLPLSFWRAEKEP